MAYRLSVLDKCLVQRGERASDALERITRLAQLAERLGFQRFWFAEHHGSPAVASSAPEILIAHILAKTSRIRLGAGGIMLQHYSAYKVAETFNTLAALAPDRVDLGVGKSPGGFPHSTTALQTGRDKTHWPSFTAQLSELDLYLERKFERGLEGAVAAPLPAVAPERFLLGGSVESAVMAAEAGWQFAFAGQINGNLDLIERSFSAYERAGGKVRPVLALLALAADAKDQALAAVDGLQTFRLTLPGGHSVNLMSREQAVEYARQAGAATYDILDTKPGVLAGTADDVRAELDGLHRRFGVEEFVIETPVVTPAQRQRSIELLGEGNSARVKAV